MRIRIPALFIAICLCIGCAPPPASMPSPTPTAAATLARLATATRTIMPDPTTISMTSRERLLHTPTQTFVPTATTTSTATEAAPPPSSPTSTPSATLTIAQAETTAAAQAETTAAAQAETTAAAPAETRDAATVTPIANQSILTNNQVIGDYGRGFNYIPQRDRELRKLGHTAFYFSASEYLDGNAEREGILGRAARLDALNGPQIGVIPAVFLIYEGAALLPNTATQDFLISSSELYDYMAQVDYDATHLDPFLPETLEQPFMIFLDHQLGYGGEMPVTRAVQQMLPLLRDYPNLHFFVDPEFRVTTETKAAHGSGETLAPGVPVGFVEAHDVNQAQWLIHNYVATQELGPWRQAQGGTAEVILGIHQFQDLNIGKDTPSADQRTMIVDKEHIEAVPGITIVFDYDGVHPAHYGGSAAKYDRYRQAMDPNAYPAILDRAFPGVKVFPANPYLALDRIDLQPWTLSMLAGAEPVPDGGWFDFHLEKGTVLPRIIIIT